LDQEPRICHPGENCLKHAPSIVGHLPPPPRKSIMKFLIDRLFSDIDRLFDDEWLVIWLLDDF
jgi:hypothetical protein